MTEMQQQIIKWLANGETGTSSKTMAFVIGFDVIPSRSGYPHDVSDFRRCFQLVEAAPEMRKHIYKMKAISPIWSEFAENWEELERRYRAEQGQGRLPHTYALIQQITDKDQNVIRMGNVNFSFSQ